MHKHLRCIFFSFLFCLLLHSISWAQKNNLKYAIEPLEPVAIIEANILEEKFNNWAANFKNKVMDRMAKDKEQRDVLIVASISPDHLVDFHVAVRPEDEALRSELMDSLQSVKDLNTDYTTINLLWEFYLNGGNTDSVATYAPKPHLPTDLVRQDFEQFSLKLKHQDLQAWADEQALPLVADLLSSAEGNWKGVKEVSDMIKDKKYQEQSVLALTDGNEHYWQAMMDLSPDVQLMPVVKLLMHMAKGEFDLAKNYITILRLFSQGDEASTYFLQEAEWRIKSFKRHLEEEIEVGIQLHELGDYDKAIAYYRELVNKAPHNAALQYELYYSQKKKLMKEDSIGYDPKDEVLWNETKKLIYECDPLYPFNVRAKTGLEGYEIMRRGELLQLFQNKKQLKKDLANLAAIAIDLKDYAYAAHLYWNYVVVNFEADLLTESDRKAYFLYSLHELDQDGVIKDDPMVSDKELWKKVEDKLQKRVEESEIYRAFGK